MCPYVLSHVSRLGEACRTSEVVKMTRSTDSDGLRPVGGRSRSPRVVDHDDGAPVTAREAGLERDGVITVARSMEDAVP